MTKAPTPTENSKTQRDNIKTLPNKSITQRFRTDLGRSVRVTVTTTLVWLNRLKSAQPSHSPPKVYIYARYQVLEQTLTKMLTKMFTNGRTDGNHQSGIALQSDQKWKYRPHISAEDLSNLSSIPQKSTDREK